MAEFLILLLDDRSAVPFQPLGIAEDRRADDGEGAIAEVLERYKNAGETAPTIPPGVAGNLPTEIPGGARLAALRWDSRVERTVTIGLTEPPQA